MGRCGIYCRTGRSGAQNSKSRISCSRHPGAQAPLPARSDDIRMTDRNRMDENPEPSSLADHSSCKLSAGQRLWRERSQKLGAALSGETPLLWILVMRVLIGAFWLLL